MDRHSRSIGMTWSRSSNVYERSPVERTIPAVKRRPRLSRSLRRLRKSVPLALWLALTLKASTRPSSCSAMRSTSSPSEVLQCPTIIGSGIHEICFRSSLTTKVSRRCPNSDRADGSRVASRGSFARFSRAASPESTMWTLTEVTLEMLRICAVWLASRSSSVDSA